MGSVGGCDSTTLSTTEYDQCLAQASTNTVVQTQPPMTFDVQASEPLSGIVPVQIQVDIASRVKVLVFEESYTTPIYLGYAKQIQPNLWEYPWDTTKFKDVKYRVAADVTNVYTIGQPYRDSDDSGYLQVDNTPPPPTSVVATTTGSTVDEKPAVHVRLTSSDPISGIVSFEVQVPGADEVILYAHHKDSGSNNRLGSATYKSGDIWLRDWNTTNYNNGDYLITTKIKNSYGIYLDGKVGVTVENIGTTPAPDTTQVDTTSTNQTVDSVDSVDVVDVLGPPQATLRVRESGILSETADLQVDIEAAQFVELWVIPSGSHTQKIIALANRSDPTSNRWLYTWNTRSIPNGDYSLFARVKNSFGLYKSNIEQVVVFNEPFEQNHTQEQEQEIKNLELAQGIENEVILEAETDDTLSALDQETDEGVVRDEVDQILASFSEEIDDELRRLITSYRSNDTEAIRRAEDRIDKLKQEIVDSIIGENRTVGLLSRLDDRFNKIVSDYKVLTVRVESLILERVGEAVFEDSDLDGISDYDERTLYGTNPYSADTDGDGFNDGAEVEQGYDPLDAKREVAIIFESPKDKGITRDDILLVESIVAIVPEDSENDADGVPAQAVISGTALPNSFVTLYIYSTPIVVTVKTEADGSWKYRFDKELEDGEHNIYVGVTDNAGRIVAKSAPFTFVKNAQAFTPVDAANTNALVNNQSDDTLLSGYMIYLILSVSVVSIGLVLILLGLHLDSRQRRFKGVVNTEEES